MIKVTIEDNRNIGFGLNVKNDDATYGWVSYDPNFGFYFNTCGRFIHPKEFDTYLKAIKTNLKIVKDLNKKYGHTM
jgi:hypothetical protein